MVGIHSLYLHSSGMFLEDVCRSTPWVPHTGVPHIDKIIVSTASKEPAARGPLDPTYVKGVCLEGVRVELGYPDIVVVDMPRLGTAGE